MPPGIAEAFLYRAVCNHRPERTAVRLQKSVPPRSHTLLRDTQYPARDPTSDHRKRTAAIPRVEG